MAFATTSTKTTSLFSFSRSKEVPVMEGVLYDLKKRKEKQYDILVYMATRDAMHDNLVAEALSVGISVDQITHAMFSCTESCDFLREALRARLDLNVQVVVENILDVLQKGIAVDYRKFTNGLLVCEKVGIDRASYSRDLEMSEYVEVEKELLCCEPGATAYKHRNGVFRIETRVMTGAIAPHATGVKYYRRKEEYEEENEKGGDERSEKKGEEQQEKEGEEPIAQTPRKGFWGQKTVDELVSLGCEEVIAWRLLTAIVVYKSDGSLSPINDDSLRDKLVQSFKIISGFFTELRRGVQKAQKVPLEKRLIGTKRELLQISDDRMGEVRQRFVLSRSLYETALEQMSIYFPTQLPEAHLETLSLEPLTVTFFGLDAMATHLKLLEELMQKTESICVGNCFMNWSKCQFNALEVAILAAFNGNRIDGSIIASASQRGGSQFLYQNDDDAKSLFTPFSNLVLFATTKFHDIKAYPVQHLVMEDSLNNWVALRAALEFDIEKREYIVGTPEFKNASVLVSKSLVAFIDDTPRRFVEWFRALPNTISVANLSRLCDMLAKRTGASSPWLVREMISRCIVLGAKVVVSADLEGGLMMCDGYGEMERKVKEITSRKFGRQLPVSDKELQFDCKVSIMGVRWHLDTRARVILESQHLSQVGDACKVAVQFQTTPDPETAMEWLQEGKITGKLILATGSSFEGAPDNGTL